VIDAPDVPAYERDPLLRRLETNVVATGDDRDAVPATPAAPLAEEAPEPDDAASGAPATVPAAGEDEDAPPEQPATAAMRIRQGIAAAPSRRREEREERQEREEREECGEREERAGTARLVRMPLGRYRRTAGCVARSRLGRTRRRRCPHAAAPMPLRGGPKLCAG
jgi:hypothetical protein